METLRTFRVICSLGLCLILTRIVQGSLVKDDPEPADRHQPEGHETEHSHLGQNPSDPSDHQRHRPSPHTEPRGESPSTRDHQAASSVRNRQAANTPSEHRQPKQTTGTEERVNQRIRNPTGSRLSQQVHSNLGHSPQTESQRRPGNRRPQTHETQQHEYQEHQEPLPFSEGRNSAGDFPNQETRYPTYSHHDSDGRHQAKSRRQEETSIPAQPIPHQQTEPNPNNRHQNDPISYDEYAKYYGSYQEGLLQSKCVCNCNNRAEPEPQVPGCEWIMIFKAVAGSGRNVLSDWLNDDEMFRGSPPEAMDIMSNVPYRNGDILDNWNQLDIRRVKIELYEDGQNMVYFHFDGIASNPISWMAEERIIGSSYATLREDCKSYVTLDCYDDLRHFYISRYDGDCCDTCGYLVVVEPHDDDGCCDFEDAYPKPSLLYADPNSCGGSCAYWDDGDGNPADRMVIYVKVCDLPL